MRTLIEILAGLAILANGVIYGTDVFGAIVLRPAIAAVDDRIRGVVAEDYVQVAVQLISHVTVINVASGHRGTPSCCG